MSADKKKMKKKVAKKKTAKKKAARKAESKPDRKVDIFTKTPGTTLPKKLKDRRTAQEKRLDEIMGKSGPSR